MLTAREGRLSSDADGSLNPPSAALRLKSLHGIAFVCLGVESGARNGVKTGENAALYRKTGANTDHDHHLDWR